MARTGEWGADVLGVTWSVALEEQFYLFLPLWIRFVPARWLPFSFLGLAALSPVFRGVAPLAYPPFLVPGSGEALFLGTWLAWAFANKPEIFRNSSWRKGVLGVLALSELGMVLILAKRDLGVFAVTVIATFWASFLWLVLSFMGTAWTAPLRHVALRAVGKVSYALYLFHPLVTLLFFVGFTGEPARHETGALRGLGIASLAFACTLALAAVSYFALENRLITFGRKFKYRKGIALPESHQAALKAASVAVATKP